ncbi:transcriptional regulator [Chelatococcus composti]|nr:transcriptional regulator [Chelatococcus composti]
MEWLGGLAVYIVVDERQLVTSGYVASFGREGVPSMGFYSAEFREWLQTASTVDLNAVQGFVLGDFADRTSYPELIRNHSRAPIIALSETRSLEQTLELFTAGIDDVVRKPVHVKEILARAEAVWRRVNSAEEKTTIGRLKVFYDGRDPEIDGEPLALPRRERHILQYLVRARGRRVSKMQLFNAIYGIYNESVEESVVEGHVSKLRKKLRERLGYDPIEAKRYMGYMFVDRG